MLPWPVDADQVLITTGAAGPDLVAKVLLDEGSRVLVETHLPGRAQAFAPMEPEVAGVAGDAEGIDVMDLARQRAGARFLYVLPNFQNPTGRTMSEPRRQALADRPGTEPAPGGGQPLRRPLVRHAAATFAGFALSGRHDLPGLLLQGAGPGLRLGFLVAPPPSSQLLQPSRRRPAQPQLQPAHGGRGAAGRLPGARAHHPQPLQDPARRHAGRAGREMRGLACNGMPRGRHVPVGPAAGRLDAAALLPRAVERGVAFVPGAASTPARRMRAPAPVLRHCFGGSDRCGHGGTGCDHPRAVARPPC